MERLHAQERRATLERISGEIRWSAEALADEFRAIPFGWVSRSWTFSLVHQLNEVHVSTHAGPAEILVVADEWQRDFGYRHIVVDDESVAGELAASLDESSWKKERFIIMALLSPCPDEATRHVVALEEAETGSLMRRWDLEEGHDSVAGLPDQLDQYSRSLGRLWNERCLGVRDENGIAVAVAKLRSHGSVAWVEDVYTVPEQRRRGYARRLVTRAANIAGSEGHDLTFLWADDEGWPKQIYADIGFRGVGRCWAFTNAIAA
jgi:GNAT superfamily N-acetyltransferase